MAANLTPSLLAHDDYLVFLLRQCAHYRLSTDLISATLLKAKTPEKNKTLLLALAEHLPPSQAIDILRNLFICHPSDSLVQGRLLSLLVEAGDL